MFMYSFSMVWLPRRSVGWSVYGLQSNGCSRRVMLHNCASSYYKKRKLNFWLPVTLGRIHSL